MKLSLRRFCLTIVLVCVALVAAHYVVTKNPALRDVVDRTLNPERDRPFDLSPHTSLDTDLFLLRALEEEYGGWPRDPVSNRSAVQGWLTEAQPRLTRLKLAAVDRKLETSVRDLYSQALALVETQHQSLESIAGIERADALQAEADTRAALSTVAEITGGVVPFLRQIGVPTGPAFVAGVFLGGGGGVIRSEKLKQARLAKKSAAIEAESRKLTSAFTEAHARAAMTASALAKRRDWKAGEAGFDGFSTADLRVLAQRRPRDPFVALARARSLLAKPASAVAMVDARECLAAARFVPAGVAFDGYRTNLVQVAAEIAVKAAERELAAQGNAYTTAKVRSAPEAVRFCRTLLATDAKDESALGRVLLARACAMAGRFSAAAEVATSVADRIKTDPGFCYRYARLMSLTGRTEAVGDWLKAAYRAGYTDVDSLRRDPDLALFRVRHAGLFQELTTVRFTWRVKFGFRNDDIVLVNESPFALTNIRFGAQLQKRGPLGAASGHWTCDRNLSSLAAGAPHVFPNVFSIPRNSFDSASAQLVCDQSPET